MTASVQKIPDGYQAVMPYLCVRGGPAAVEFYKKAFGATEVMRMSDPNGNIGHAEFRVGEGVIMLSDEFPEMGVLSPQSLGGTPVTLMFYCEDVDAVVNRALECGAKAITPVENMFYGDRAGKIEDPFGHYWWIATRVEDVSHEEMRKRSAALYGMS